MHESEELIRQALCAGVRAVVVERDGEGHLIAAVEAVLRHDVYFSPKVSETLRDALIRTPEEGVAYSPNAKGNFDHLACYGSDRELPGRYPAAQAPNRRGCNVG
jgi:DNA-binding NarL/FixJ family response regulator